MLATATIQGWSGIYFAWSFWLCGYYSKKHGNLCPDRFGRFPTKNLEILLPPVLVTSEVGSSYPLTDILWLISSDWYPWNRKASLTHRDNPPIPILSILSLPTCGQNKALLLTLWSPYCKHDKGGDSPGEGAVVDCGCSLEPPYFLWRRPWNLEARLWEVQGKGL